MSVVGRERLRYSLTGEVSCQCEDGWQRLGSGGQCHQHSTQAWYPQGQLLQVRKYHEVANPSWDLLWLCHGGCLITGSSTGWEPRSVQAPGQVCRGQWYSGTEDTHRWTVMVNFNIQYFCCRDWIWRGGQSSELFLQQDQRHYNGNVRRGTAMAWRTWTVLRDQEKSIIHA